MSGVRGSDVNDGRLDPAGLEQPLEVGLVTGQDPSLRWDEERHVGIDDVAPSARREQLADSPSGGVVERRNLDAGEDAGEVGLAAPVSPRLTCPAY